MVSYKVQVIGGALSCWVLYSGGISTSVLSRRARSVVGSTGRSVSSRWALSYIM